MKMEILRRVFVHSVTNWPLSKNMWLKLYHIKLLKILPTTNLGVAEFH